jgi:hypothetical protein
MLSQSALMWTWIAAGIFAFLAANVAYGIWLQRTKMRGGRHWPAVSGEITVSEVEQPESHDSDDDLDCVVNIRYRYRVGAKDYEGNAFTSAARPARPASRPRS